MRNAKLLVAALGLATLTAGCVQESTTYYPRGTAAYYPSSNGYYSNSQAQAQARNDAYWNSSRRDADRDGIPNRYDRDANGDRVPDRYQGR